MRQSDLTLKFSKTQFRKKKIFSNKFIGLTFENINNAERNFHFTKSDGRLQ